MEELEKLRRQLFNDLKRYRQLASETTDYLGILNQVEIEAEKGVWAKVRDVPLKNGSYYLLIRNRIGGCSHPFLSSWDKDGYWGWRNEIGFDDGNGELLVLI